jgi:hypothetical protein
MFDLLGLVAIYFIIYGFLVLVAFGLGIYLLFCLLTKEKPKWQTILKIIGGVIIFSLLVLFIGKTGDVLSGSLVFLMILAVVVYLTDSSRKSKH